MKFTELQNLFTQLNTILNALVYFQCKQKGVSIFNYRGTCAIVKYDIG